MFSQWFLSPQNDCLPTHWICFITVSRFDHKRELVSPHNDFVWLSYWLLVILLKTCVYSQWVYGHLTFTSMPSQWLCLPLHWLCMLFTMDLCGPCSEFACLHNDFLWHSQWHCVYSKWFWVLKSHNDLVWLHSDRMIFTLTHLPA